MTDVGQSRTAMSDERYSAGHYAYGVEPNAFLLAQADRLKAGKEGSPFTRHAFAHDALPMQCAAPDARQAVGPRSAACRR